MVEDACHSDLDLLYSRPQMDEQLPAIVDLWDPVEAAPVRSRIPAVKREKKLDKQQFLQDIHGAYIAIGGHARLAHVANEDPKWFLSRFLTPGILLPTEKQEIDMTVHIHPALQRSALDGEYTDVTGDRPNGAESSGHTLPQGRPPSVIGDPDGPEHPASQDGSGGSLQFALDQKTGRAGSRS